MKVFLAGGIAGNLNPLWKKIAQGYTEDEAMKLFLAGNAPWHNEGIYDSIICKHKPFILESFYYVNEDTERLLPFFGDFLLDSGAFTLRQNVSGNIDWDDYIVRYADFIRTHNVEKFFELDIDNLVGLEEVKRLRRLLETRAQRQCITVWHPSRGWDDFVQQTKERPYVSLGGIVGASMAVQKTYQKTFPKFIQTAHENGAKIHGLGYTSLNGLKVNHFDSVDSTAWTTGNRFGYIYQFKNGTMTKIDVPKGKRLADGRKVALINYSEWIKFQKYALTHL